MRKKWRIILTSLLVLILSGFAWLVLSRPREPVYQGKPLSYWLSGFDDFCKADLPSGPPAPTYTEAWEAIRQNGTNALPSLLRMLKKRKPDFIDRIMAVAHKQHFIRIPYFSRGGRGQAVCGFKALGSGASNAVPLLITMFDRDPSASSQTAVPAILASIGPSAAQAIPALLRGMRHTNEIVRNNAI